MKREWLAQNKDGLHNLGPDDLLSRLPDEILVSILSSFTLREAAVTSKLSRRWRYLWCQTDRLVFEDRKRWNLRCFYSNAERDEYMSWVNHIINQHRSSTIDKFKICIGLDENAKDTIPKWIEFAISKNVQKLELNLMRRITSSGNYCFPDEIFERKCGSSLKRQPSNVPVMEIKFLKSLILNYVDVNDEGLRKILSNCPVLEHLSIHFSCKLVKAEIYGKGLALKNLDIVFCDELESVDICDSNIVSFNCRGSQNTLRLDNLQKLEKIGITKGYSWEKINDMFCQMSCVPYLEVLELDLYCVKRSLELHSFPKLQKLKQLTINVVNHDEEDNGFLVLASLLKACPSLHRLTITKISCLIGEEMIWEVSQMPKVQHQCLEVVEIAEYGWTSDLELAMYFFQNCVALKKLVIKPTMKDKNAQQQLERRTPDGVDLVIP